MIALFLLVPIAFLILQATEVGWGHLSSVLFRSLTVSLLWNTIRLDLLVVACAALVGVGAAWLIERSDLPARRLFSVLAVLPLAIPDFIVGYGWVSVAPSVHGLWGAVLVMTMGTYPLVYLPVAAAFRRSDPALEEVAQSAGYTRRAVFWRVTLPEVRLAVLGGALLVSLTLLAEYGAFEILGYQTFTTEIFTEFQIGFNLPAACALSLVLVVLGLLFVSSEFGAQRRSRSIEQVQQSTRPPSRQRLGRATPLGVLALLSLAAVALGMPVGTLIYWLFSGQKSTLPPASLLDAAAHSALYAAFAGLVSTAAAFPVAYLAVRHRGMHATVIERSAYLVQGLPGLAIALALAFFTIRFMPALYQSAPLLVLSYAILFFPLALVALRASLAQAPRVLEDVARSLGHGPFAVLVRVTLPLIAPGIGAAFALVFLSSMTELTSTLILIPTDAQTLATQFWAYTSDFAYAQAAPYAALIIAIAAVPSYILARRFDPRALVRESVALAQVGA